MRTRGEFFKKTMNCSYQLHNLECKAEHNNQKKKLHCDFIAVNIRTYLEDLNLACRSVSEQ